MLVCLVLRLSHVKTEKWPLDPTNVSLYQWFRQAQIVTRLWTQMACIPVLDVIRQISTFLSKFKCLLQHGVVGKLRFLVSSTIRLVRLEILATILFLYLTLVMMELQKVQQLVLLFQKTQPRWRILQPLHAEVTSHQSTFGKLWVGNMSQLDAHLEIWSIWSLHHHLINLKPVLLQLPTMPTVRATLTVQVLLHALTVRTILPTLVCKSKMEQILWLGNVSQKPHWLQLNQISTVLPYSYFCLQTFTIA